MSFVGWGSNADSSGKPIMPKATTGSGKAFGLDRVPYDNYLTYLHEGERVLTAREAREQDKGRRSNLQITITGNSFGAGVSAEEIAQRLADQIEMHLAAGALS